MNHPELCIAGRKIGLNYPPLVIAEIGINHGGSLTVAKEMVDAACSAGAEIVKHQTHIVEDEMTDEAKHVIPANSQKSIYSVMEECALTASEEAALKMYAEAKGLIYISTPFSRAAVDLLESLDVPAYKIGSGECNNLPLVDYIASFGRPIILSTGMNDMKAISKTVDVIRKHGVPYALLHCTSVYPTPAHMIRLGVISQLQESFPDAVVGLSDHSIGNYACLGAVTLGASIVERHFTDVMSRIGNDIECSMDETALKELITGTQFLFEARGGCKEILNEEISTANFAYASVVSIKNINKGDALSKDNIWVKRPGTGTIRADAFEDLLGRCATCDIAVGTQMAYEFVESL